MADSRDGPDPPEAVLDELLRQVDSLQRLELKQLHSYVQRRIESLKQSLEAEIEAETAGELLDIERHGGYAIVRQHPPDPDGESSILMAVRD